MNKSEHDELDREVAEVFFPEQWKLDLWSYYSKKIELAWKVVEEMNQREYHFLIHSFDDGGSYAIFHYGKFVNAGDLDERGTALADSAPEAICRAALEAIENEQKVNTVTETNA